MRAVDALMECLKAEGVDVVFGLPGGANLPTYDAFVDGGIRHILVRHEAGGGHAAEGYAKATGKVGVAFATSGPGATNLITPICDAMMDSVPVRVHHRPGAHRAARHRRLPGGRHDRHHDAGRQALVHDPAPAGDPAGDPRGLPHRPHRAARARCWSTSPRTSPAAEIDYEPVSDVRLPGYQPTVEGNQKQIRQAAKALAARAAPGDLRGRRRRQRGRLRRSCVEFATCDRFPVTCTLMGLGAFPARRTRSGWGCSACTARARPTTRWTRPT